MSSSCAFLSHLTLALGERGVDLETSAASGRLLSRADDLRSAGFERHWLAAEDSTGLDLAIRAVSPLRDELVEVDVLIYATALPCNSNVGRAEDFAATGDVRHLMDFPASRLQTHFALHEATVIGIGQQACTGVLGALRLGRSLLASEPELRRVLCVTADRFPEGAHYEQAYNLISDGASACLLSRQPRGFRIIAGHHITNGAQARVSSEETAGAFFPYMHRLVTETLAKAGHRKEQLAWVVTQNTYTKAWLILSSLLGLDPGIFYHPTLADVGHVISSDCLANLAELERQQSLVSGDMILLIMAGYGSNWQSVLLERV